MAKKIKITRKQMQQPDEFITWFDRVVDYMQTNSLQVIIALCAVVLAVAAGEGIRRYRESKAEASILALSDAIATLQAPLQSDLNDKQILSGIKSYPTETARSAEAISLLEKVSKDYPGTPQANQAQLFLAGAQFDNKNYLAAVESYNKYLQSNPNLDPAVRAVALMGLASSHFNLGNFKEALDSYRQIIEVKNALNRDEALVGASRCQENLGDTDQAIAYLKQALEEYPNTVAARGAASRIRLLEKAKAMQPKEKEPVAKQPAPAKPAPKESAPK